jgi:ABC-type uncharacterized transport system permease subunit
MMSTAAIPLEITAIVQSMVIIFIAAPDIVRALYGLRKREEVVPTVITRGWGS